MSELAGCINTSTSTSSGPTTSEQDSLGNHTKCEFVSRDNYHITCGAAGPQLGPNADPTAPWVCTDRLDLGPWRQGDLPGVLSVWYNPQTNQNGILYSLPDALFPLFAGFWVHGTASNSSFGISNAPNRAFLIAPRQFDMTTDLQSDFRVSNFTSTGNLPNDAVHEVYWFPPTNREVESPSAIHAFNVNGTPYYFFAQLRDPFGGWRSNAGGTWQGNDYSLNITMLELASAGGGMIQTRLPRFSGLPPLGDCLS
jgi:hypothetical protein